MEEEIAKAKKLLAENGYIVKKWTHSMEEDANECEEMEEKGMSREQAEIEAFYSSIK